MKGVAWRIGLFAAGLMVVGCAPKAEAPGNPGASVAGGDKPRFALCPKSINNPFFDAVRAGARDAAKELKIPEPDWVGPTQAIAGQQVTMIGDAITRGVKGLAISPNIPDTITDVVARAMDSKVPTICFDSDAPKSRRICYVGTDNYRAGRLAGEQMKKLMGGQGKVLIVTGGLAAANLNERIRGYHDALMGTPGITDAGPPEACDDNQSKAHQIIQDFLLGHPDTKGIFAVGLWAAIPAAQILHARGLSGKVKVVGFDVLKEELLLLKSGDIQALLGQRPHRIGYDTVKMLWDLHQGKKPARVINDTGIDVVTQANVDEFLSKAAM
ncbi:MAG TPA: sugar-binding protein [Armatimonadota bacterium]|jgi:ribose transport system substrate-binding protein